MGTDGGSRPTKKKVTESDFSKLPKQAMKHYWSATLNDLTMNSKDAYDLWVLSGKPKYGCVFDIMKYAKYKYKLAMLDVIRSYFFSSFYLILHLLRIKLYIIKVWWETTQIYCSTFRALSSSVKSLKIG